MQADEESAGVAVKEPLEKLDEAVVALGACL